MTAYDQLLNEYINKYEELAKVHNSFLVMAKFPIEKFEELYVYLNILSKITTDQELYAAMYYDLLKDYDQELEIYNELSVGIKKIINGLKSIENLPEVRNDELLEKNHRQLFISLAKDVRVILLKLVYRLYFLKINKHTNYPNIEQIAQETLKIYVPIAHRLGLGEIKADLEDLSLYYVDYDGYKKIARALSLKKSQRSEIIEKMIAMLKESLNDFPNVLIMGRPKSIYSIYQKINVKNKNFSDIYDLQALRIICTTNAECYNILGIIHQQYTPIPNRFKDYIALPKENMYQSLHTSIVGVEGYPFEIQIRTEEMDAISERGIAAHWGYKEEIKTKNSDTVESKLHLFRELIGEGDSTNSEYFEMIKEEVFDNNIFTITPQGSVIHLPKDATVIDFAYRIHSSLAEKMIGAKVNGTMVSFSKTLKTGDIVEIITKRNASGPTENWLNLARTSQAKSKIKNYLRRKTQKIESEKLDLGRTYLLEYLKTIGKDSQLFDDQKTLVKTLNQIGFKEYDDFLLSVVKQKKTAKIFVDKLLENLHAGTKKNLKIEDKNKLKFSTESILISGADGIFKELSKCCNPVKGDNIKGVVTSGKAIKIHRETCQNIEEEDINKILPAEWNLEYKNQKYTTKIIIKSLDLDGVISEITAILSNSSISVNSFSSKHIANDGQIISIEGLIDNVESVNTLIENLKKVRTVLEVKR